MKQNKKALSAVVTIILLLALAVSGYFFFEGFFFSNYKKIETDYQLNERADTISDIFPINNDELKIKTYFPDEISKIEIIDPKSNINNCYLTPNILGQESENIVTIDVSICSLIKNKIYIVNVIKTNKDFYSKQVINN